MIDNGNLLIQDSIVNFDEPSLTTDDQQAT